LRLKCTIFDYHLGSVPDFAGGAYSSPQISLAVFRWPVLRERRERGRKRREGNKIGRNGEEKERSNMG